MNFLYLAETVVANETQSLVRFNGAEPVMSSHCVGAEPPGDREMCFAKNLH